mmetsp:Transcript_2165/g.2918  ORF Transcript_2165/g.2918 Transcript_2165/m.2918 type:complete len:108 (-) Transcript_2165:928-1251(-)
MLAWLSMSSVKSVFFAGRTETNNDETHPEVAVTCCQAQATANHQDDIVDAQNLDLLDGGLGARDFLLELLTINSLIRHNYYFFIPIVWSINPSVMVCHQQWPNETPF